MQSRFMTDSKHSKIDIQVADASGGDTKGTGDKARDKVIKTLSASVPLPLATQIEAGMKRGVCTGSL